MERLGRLFFALWVSGCTNPDAASGPVEPSASSSSIGRPGPLGGLPSNNTAPFAPSSSGDQPDNPNAAGGSTANAPSSSANGSSSSGPASVTSLPASGGAGLGGSRNLAGAGGESRAGAAAGGSLTGAGGASVGGNSGTSGGTASGGAGNPSAGVELDGRVLLVDGEPFMIQGVCWNPVPRGQVHPEGLDFAGFAEQDIALMQAAGINVVRTYEPLMDRDVLDQLYAAGIYVLNSVYVWGGDDASVVTGRVAAIADHPAVLMWVLGNEWNYNGLYVDLSHEESLQRLNQAAELVKAASDRPVASIYGELPSVETIAQMPNIDVWGINSYRGISFGDLFDSWADLTEKPMFLGEYGADAYNALTGQYDPTSQAEAVDALTREIREHASAVAPNGVAMGGTIFEWADEWWKDQAGNPDAQDVGGIAPGGGPHPDQVFNEEWWGIVDIERTPRPAYDALRTLYTQ